MIISNQEHREREFGLLKNITQQVIAITQPFLVEHGLTHFAHVELHDNQQRYCLTTDINMVDDYYNKEKIYEKNLGVGQQIYVLWGCAEKKDKPLFDLIREKYQLGNGFSIIKQYRGVQVQSHFATHPSRVAVNNFYLNHLDTLHLFCHYFKDMAFNLIREVKHTGLLLPVSKNNINIWEGHENPYTIENNNKNYQPSRIFINPYVWLTPREFQCLKGYLTGNSFKQIGLSLGISSKTVEFYLQKSKNKFQAYTKSELFVKATRSLGNILFVDDEMNR